MRKKLILENFYRLNCIISNETLEKYIDFCINNDVNEKRQNKTSSHHILPVAKTLPFNNFKDLKIFSWNKAELTYYNHYIAHYLLVKAINHISIINAFTGMHTKDLIIGRINSDELISENEYNEIYKQRNILISKYRKEIIKTEYGNITRAQFYYLKNKHTYKESYEKTAERMKTNNIINLPGVLAKMRKTKSETFINDKNIDKIAAEKAAATMKNMFTLNGKLTTRYKENGKKLSTYLNTVFENSDGNKTTIAKEKGKKHSKALIAKGKWFLLKNVFNEDFEQKISYSDLRKISPGLADKTNENYLGKSLYGSNYLKKKNKEHLIGLYVEKL